MTQLDDSTEKLLNRILVQRRRAKGSWIIGSVVRRVEAVTIRIGIRDGLGQNTDLCKNFEIRFVIAVNYQDRHSTDDLDLGMIAYW